MAFNIAELFVTLGLNDKALKSGTKGATTALSGLGKQAVATAAGFIGAGSLQAAVSGVGRAIGDSVKRFAALETAMAEVSTLVNTSEVDMDELRKGVLKLSTAYGEDAGGLTNALYQTISAGIPASEAIKFLGVASAAAIGGVTDTKTAVDALTSGLNAYGLDASKVEEVSDSLFTTIRLGKTTMAELSPVIGQVAPLAAAAGVSLDEMNAALATMTLAGLSTAEAGTGIRGMLNALIKPTKDAQKASKLLGIEWGIDGVKAAGGFANFIRKLSVATGGSTKALAKLFPEIRGLNGALILTGKGLDNFSGAMDDMAEKTGATAEAAEKMKDTISFKWDVFIKGATNASISLVELLEPALRKTISAMTETVKSVGYVAEAMGFWAGVVGSLFKTETELEELIKKREKTTDDYTLIIELASDRLKKLTKNGELLISEIREENEQRGKQALALEQTIALSKTAIDVLLDEELALSEENNALGENAEQLEANKEARKALVDALFKEIEAIKITKDEYINADDEKIAADLKVIQNLLKQLSVRGKAESEQAKTLEKNEKVLLKIQADRIKLEDKLSKQKLKLQEDVARSALEFDKQIHESTIERLEDEIEAEETGATRKEELQEQISLRRIKILQSEKKFFLDKIKREYEANKESLEKQEGDTSEHLKLLEQNYELSSKNIEKVFADKIVKETAVLLDMEMKEGVLDRLTNDIVGNFDDWADGYSENMATAISDGITDIGELAGELSRFWGGFSEDTKTNLGNFTDLVTAAFTGDVFGTITTGLKWVADSLFGAGKNSKEAAEEEHKAAIEAREAARSFLLSQSKLELTLMTTNELQKTLADIEEEELKFLGDIGIVRASVQDLLQKVTKTELIGFKKAFEKDPEGVGLQFRGVSLSVEEKGQLKRLFDLGEERTLLGFMGEKGKVVTEQVTRAGLSPEEARNPYNAKTWAGFKQLLNAKRDREGMSDEEYKRQLYAGSINTVYKDDVSPTERTAIVGDFVNLPALGAGAIVTRPTRAIIGEAGPEAVIPLDRMQEVMAMMQGGETGMGGTVLSISLLLDPNIPINVDTAETLSYSLAQQIVEQSRAQGVM